GLYNQPRGYFSGMLLIWLHSSETCAMRSVRVRHARFRAFTRAAYLGSRNSCIRRRHSHSSVVPIFLFSLTDRVDTSIMAWPFVPCAGRRNIPCHSCRHLNSAVRTASLYVVSSSGFSPSVCDHQ